MLPFHDNFGGRCWKALLAFAISILAAGGFGSWLLFCAAGLAVCLVLALQQPRRCAYPMVFALLLAVFPECGVLASAWALLLAARREYGHGAALLISQLPWLLSPVLPLPVTCFHPIGGVLLYLAALAVFRKAGQRWKAVCYILYAGTLLFNTFCTPCRFAAAPASADAGYGFRIGEELERCLGHKLRGDGILRYNQREEAAIPAGVPTYLDHDAWTQYDDANISQNRPWHANLVYAGERVRFASRRDGALLFNIGAKLRDDTGGCLYAIHQDGRLYTLAARKDGCLLLGDSDYVTNSGVPYQENLIRSLAGEDTHEHILFSLLAAVLVLAALKGGRCRRTVNVSLAALCPVIFFLCVSGWGNEEGCVRYIGRKHYWMHTTLGEGLVRQLQQVGIPARFGNTGATYLVIGQGYSAEWRGEPVVILEPGASVRMGEEVYTAEPHPLGEQNGIPDARRISPTGSAGRLETGKAVIYATGSPCALPLQKP